MYPGFAVYAAEPARVDLVLKVGSLSQEVTVTGEVPTAVNTITANEGNTITGQQVNSLPLTNRVFTQLMSLEPGVSQPVMNDVSPGFGSNSFVDFSFNGVRDDENNLLIDGVRNVDTFGGNAFVGPNLFAVSEVRIENNDYTATAEFPDWMGHESDPYRGYGKSTTLSGGSAGALPVAALSDRSFIFGTGGGTSLTFPKPAFQSGLSGTMRNGSRYLLAG